MRIASVPILWAASALLVLVGSGRVHGAPDEPVVAVRTLDLSRVSGTLVRLDARGVGVRSGDASAVRSFPLDEVVSVAFPPGETRRVRGPRFRAYLVGGERIVGHFKGPAEDGIVLDTPGIGDVKLLFDAILTLESFPADAGPCHDLRRRHERPDSGDRAYDASDDEFDGTVQEATAGEIVILSRRQRTRTVAWSDLRVLHLENDEMKPPEGVSAEIELGDGSRLITAGRVQLTSKGLRFKLRSAPDPIRTAPLTAVKTIRWTGGRFVYASALPFKIKRKYYHPTREDQKPFMERWHGTRVDKRASGCPLRLAGRTYRHGFGVNSYSEIHLRLDGAYSSFRSTFGIDDEVLTEVRAGGTKGNLDARVVADGKVLWEAKGVRGGEKARRIGPLDVTGVKELVLIVDFGKEMMSLDRGDWCDPILVKK